MRSSRQRTPFSISFSVSVALSLSLFSRFLYLSLSNCHYLYLYLSLSFTVSVSLFIPSLLVHSFSGTFLSTLGLSLLLSVKILLAVTLLCFSSLLFQQCHRSFSPTLLFPLSSHSLYFSFWLSSSLSPLAFSISSFFSRSHSLLSFSHPFMFWRCSSCLHASQCSASPCVDRIKEIHEKLLWMQKEDIKNSHSKP